MRHLSSTLNSEVQGSINDWYKGFWKERLQIQRKIRYIKKALKRYKLSQQELGLLAIGESFEENSKYPLYDTLQDIFLDLTDMISYCKRHDFKDLIKELGEISKVVADLQHKTERM